MNNNIETMLDIIEKAKENLTDEQYKKLIETLGSLKDENEKIEDSKNLYKLSYYVPTLTNTFGIVDFTNNLQEHTAISTKKYDNLPRLMYYRAVLENVLDSRRNFQVVHVQLKDEDVRDYIPITVEQEYIVITKCEKINL